MKDDSKYNQLLIDAVNHLRSCDVSLNEFYNYRTFFESKNDNGRYNHILSKVLNDNDIFRAYGTNVKEKSYKWLDRKSVV